MTRLDFLKKILEGLEKEKSCYESSYNVGIENAIKVVKSAEAEYKGGWILCSEKLPETRDNLLICQIDGYVNVGFYSLEEFKDLNNYPYKDVIAWQPLPEPYKGE